MATKEREIDIDGEGMIAFRADGRGEVTGFVEERGLRRREGRGAADVLVDEHGVRPADEVAYADMAAELDGARIGATPYPFDAHQSLGRAGHEHQFDPLSAQDGGQFRDLDVEADHDDATDAAEGPEADAVAADESGFPWGEVQFVLMTESDAVPDRRTVAELAVRAEERHRTEYEALVGLRQARSKRRPKVGPEEPCDAAELVFTWDERLEAHPEEFRQHHEIGAVIPGFAHLRADPISKGVRGGRGDADVEGQQGEEQESPKSLTFWTKTWTA